MVLDCVIQTLKWQHKVDYFRKIFVLIGVVGVALAAFKNSKTWHFDRLLEVSSDFLSERWMDLYRLAGQDEFTMASWGSFLCTFLPYWIVGGFFLASDLLGKPRWLLQYKVQEDRNMPPPTRKLLKCIAVVLFNQMVIAGPLFPIIADALIWRGVRFDKQLPSFREVVFHSVCYIVIEEIGFYYSHRLFHHPRLYKYIHKIHHEWTAPIGIVTVYCHPLEHVLANFLPVFAGPFVMGSHIAVILLWGAAAQTTAMVHHSGYHIPFMPSPQAHDYHHLKFNVNYGVLGVLDWLHGTDLMFKDTKQMERHQFLLSLEPIHKLIPHDDKAKKSD